MGTEEFWQLKTNEEIIDAAKHLLDYTESTQSKIQDEISKRGLRDSIEKKPETIVYPGPRGVGGWLLVFCVILTILIPLFKLPSLFSTYRDASRLFESFPRLYFIVLLNTVLGVGLIIFSIYAGVSLWQKNSKGPVIAKRYLFVYLVYAFFSNGLLFLAGLPTEAIEAVLREAFLNIFNSAIFAGIWYAYLERSIRVKNTFLS